MTETTGTARTGQIGQVGGVMVALATPFRTDGAVDEARLREHVEFVIEGGVHGIVPCGSTGEFAALTAAERRHVTEVVLDQAGGRVTIAPQTGSLATAEAVELTRHAEACGAHSALVVSPFYETPTRAEVIEYFGAVADSVCMPLIAYNLPAATGINLDLAFYRDLGERTDRYRAVKDASGDMDQAMGLIHNLSGSLEVLVGMDTIMVPAFAVGAAGTIWGAPNWAPRECVKIWDDVRAGDLDAARETFATMWNALDFINTEGYAVGTKAACALTGVDLGITRPPFLPFSPAKTAELDELLEPLRAARS